MDPEEHKAFNREYRRGQLKTAGLVILCILALAGASLLAQKAGLFGGSNPSDDLASCAEHAPPCRLEGSRQVLVPTRDGGTLTVTFREYDDAQAEAREAGRDVICSRFGCE